MSKKNLTQMKVRSITVPEVTDPDRKAKILKRLHDATLTYELGVATAEAGIHFDEWPFRCLQAKEFKRGHRIAATIKDHDDLLLTEDGRIINKAIN